MATSFCRSLSLGVKENSKGTEEPVERPLLLAKLVFLVHSQVHLVLKMSFGARELTILGDFKPFGLIVEALDGKPSDTCMDDYHYFLFNPEVTKQRDEADELDLPLLSDRSDHELFIRGNRIICSIGSRVYKRFTSPSTVIKACWCRMGNSSDAVLCILQSDSLSIYDTSGD